jgi:uroporphyrin-III C-methyltransferase
VSVYLVGAGPGDADLLTLRAARLLASADVVVHDRLIGEDVLALIPQHAPRYDVGKLPGTSHSQAAINELLVDLATRYERVVRLKGGDPFLFGRGGEEALALKGLGVDVEVVPGVTSALAGPALAGVPVTHRGKSFGVTIVTGRARDGAAVDFRPLANPDLTLVILMGVARRALIAAELLEGGLAPDTPVAAIERAASPDQRVRRGRLDELGRLEVENPAALIVGAVADLELGLLARYGAFAEA